MRSDDLLQEIPLSAPWSLMLKILQQNEMVARKHMKGEELDRFLNCQLELESYLTLPGTISERDLLAELDFTTPE